MIKDKNIAWKLKREFVSVYEMMGRAADMVTGLGTGAPTFQEVGSTNLAGLAIGAVGDEFFHLWKIPWDLDRGQPVQMRLIFSHSSTDADEPAWNIKLKGLANQVAVSSAASTPDETLTFAALEIAEVAHALEKTSWQSTAVKGAIALADLFVQMAIKCTDLGSAGASEITLLGVEIAYVIEATTGRRQKTDIALGTLY